MRTQINMDEFISLTDKFIQIENIKTILEIGALDGKDSLLFKSKYPLANVICIEGLTENYNIYHKDLIDIIHINIVVTDYDGVIDYHKKNINGIHGIFNRGDKYGMEIIKNVPCTRIDTLCKKMDIKSLDMVKIDVEGATYEVLLGFGDMLRKTKIIHLETESYPFFEGQRLHDDVVKLLMENNFTNIDITSVDITDEGKQLDSVWLNNNFLK